MSDGDAIVGAVLVTTGRSAVFLRIGLIWLLMLALAGAALLLAWLLARRQARRLVDPLQALSAVAERLGGGDFTVRTQAVGIAEIDSVNESVNRTAVRLGELVDRERAFSADASHQLRTPLTGLRLQLEAALDQPDADLRAAIGDALTTTDRLQATIDETPRPGPGHPRPAHDPRTSTHSWTASAGAGTRSSPQGQAAAAGRHRHPAGPGSMPRRSSDPRCADRQRRPARRGRRHGDRPRTWTTPSPIDVADEGATAAGRSRRCCSSAAPRDAAGHGIGLALARRLAESQGGRLRLSHPDPPTFTLLLPASPVASAPAEPATTMRPGRDGRG